MSKLINKIINFAIGIGAIYLGILMKNRTAKYIGVPILILFLIFGSYFIYKGSGDTPIAFAAETGFKVTGTVEATDNWVNYTTTRLNTSDNSRSSCDVSVAECNGQGSDFSFGIPAGATIDGIEVAIEWVGTGTCSGARFAGLAGSLSWNDGTNFTTEKTDTVQATEETVTFGGSTDTWGRTWDDGEFANGTFRIKTRGYNGGGSTCDPNIDLLQIKVYYTAASTSLNPLDTKQHIIWFE